jgi:predicted AlkP superfamily phosphohydrolase/phosphomutase
MSLKQKSKLLMVGLDAAELSYIREHLSELPNFAQALDRGRLTELYSQVDLINGSVWPAFFTEKSPGDHGFHSTHMWDPSSMRLRRMIPRRLPIEPFWRDLARQGVDVVAVDVPIAHTPPDGPGVEIAGWGTHDGVSSFSAHPRWLKREILRRFGRHPMGLEVPVRKSAAERERIKRRMIKGASLRAELTKWLMTTQPWDLFLIVFHELHRAGHLLWPTNDSINPELLLEVYRAVDRALGQILLAAQDEKSAIAIFALHGMGAYNSQDHFTQKILHRVNDRFIRSRTPGDPSRISRGSASRFNFVAALREIAPPWLQNAIALAVPQRARDLVVDRSVTYGHDWKHTPAIALKSDRNGYISLNIAGRERDGMLEAGSAQTHKYISDLCEGFLSYRVESGEPLVERVHLSSESAPGVRTHLLPDIIVVWREARSPAHWISSPLLGDIVADPDIGRSGHHRGKGFMVMLEPGKEGGIEERPESVTDLASIVRHALLG